MKIEGQITIGSDPEIWLVSKLTKNPIPTVGIIHAEKEKPEELLPGGWFFLRDNCSLEFNIPPAKTEREFIEFHQVAMAQLEAIVGKDYALLVQPSIEFHPDLLRSKEATEIGCSEDFNVYTEGVDKIPNLGITNKRFSGGHIHVGWKEPNWLQAMQLVKFMDLFLALPAVILDDDLERKQNYGNAGRCRVKDYGVEYRTLSNFWLSTEETLRFVYKQTMKAIDAYNNYGDTIDNFAEMIRDTVDTNNISAATELMKEFKVLDFEIKTLKDAIPAIRSYSYA